MLAIAIILTYICGIMFAYFVVLIQNTVLLELRKNLYAERPTHVAYIAFSWLYVAMVIFMYFVSLLALAITCIEVFLKNMKKKYPGRY